MLIKFAFLHFPTNWIQKRTARAYYYHFDDDFTSNAHYKMQIAIFKLLRIRDCNIILTEEIIFQTNRPAKLNEILCNILHGL